MATCLLCSSEFDGDEPICATCTAEQVEQSRYHDPDEVQVSPDGGVHAHTDHAPQPQPRQSRPTPHAVRTGPTRDPDALAPGSVVLDQYEVVRKLGQGGFGAVYLANQLGLDRKAVIKVVHARLAENDAFVHRFEREARVLATLDHHHLVKIFNFGALPSGQLYIAMEYGGDRTLEEDIQKRHRLDPRRALGITSMILDALNEAHLHSVVHRDLKPANILLGRKNGEEWVKVVDVGIAKVVGDREDTSEAKISGEGLVVGTPAYYSPEQARGLEVDGRSDLYAAGIVLYEMLTGKLPIEGRSPIDFIRAHAVDAPTPAKKHGVDLPDSIEKIIEKALQKDPAKRFQSAREMKLAVDAARESLATHSQKGRGLRKKLFIAAGVAIGALALAIGAFALSGDEEKAPAPKAAVLHIEGGADVRLGGIVGSFELQGVHVKYKRTATGVTLTLPTGPLKLVPGQAAELPLGDAQANATLEE